MDISGISLESAITLRNVEDVYVDLLNEITGELWEIKPIADQQEGADWAGTEVEIMNVLQSAGRLIGRYPDGSPYDWTLHPAGWVLGISFPRIAITLGTDLGGYFTFYAKQPEDLAGVIVWWKSRNERRDIRDPIPLPDDVVWGERNEREHPREVYIPGRGRVPNPVFSFLEPLEDPVCTASCHVEGYNPPVGRPATPLEAYGPLLLTAYCIVLCHHHLKVFEHIVDSAFPQ